MAISKTDSWQKGKYPVSSKYRQLAMIKLTNLILLLNKLSILNPKEDEEGDISIFHTYLHDKEGWRDWIMRHSPHRKEGWEQDKSES